MFRAGLALVRNLQIPLGKLGFKARSLPESNANWWFFIGALEQVPNSYLDTPLVPRHLDLPVNCPLSVLSTHIRHLMICFQSLAAFSAQLTSVGMIESV